MVYYLLDLIRELMSVSTWFHFFWDVLGKNNLMICFFQSFGCCSRVFRQKKKTFGVYSFDFNLRVV